MKQRNKETIIYIITSILIISTFIIGNIIGFVAMSEQPDVDHKVVDALNKNDKVRVILTEKDESNTRLFSSKSAKLDDVMREKNIKSLRSKSNRDFTVAEITREEFEELKRSGALNNIIYDEPIRIMLSDSTQIIQSAQLNAYELNSQKIRGEGETACVIDTGINYKHPSLGGCTSEEYLSGECAKVIGGKNLINESNPDILDDQGHGSHVSGIIAGDGDVIGVAPKAKLVGVKALDKDGDGLVSSLIDGIEWCTENKDTYNISVISISAGSLTLHQDTCDADYEWSTNIINNATAKNLSIVVATGNDGDYEKVAFPACISNATPVTSINKNKEYASSANRGVNFENMFVAPGVNILSAHLGPDNDNMSGTSMATPHVSGGIALLKQANKVINNKDLTDEEVKSLLKNTSENLYDAETQTTFPLIQLMNATNKINTDKPQLTLTLNDTLIIKNETDNNISINWTTQSNTNHTTLLKINNIQNETLLNSTKHQYNLSISENNLTNKDNNTLLGEYEVILFAENEKGDATIKENFYYKQEPLFNLTIKNLTNEMNITGTYNISVQPIESENITLMLNNETINESHAQNITLSEGEHNITAKHNETDEYLEFEKIKTLNLTKPTPIITNVTPSDFNLSVQENETIFFNQTSENPVSGNLTINWREENNKNETQIINDTYLFNARYKDNATVYLIVENDYENTSVNWTINIESMPLIEKNKSPSENNITLEFNETQLFVFEVEDYYNRTINTTWTINNETNTTQNNNETFSFNATSKENGTHNLFVNSTNNKTYINNTWTITIMPEPYLTWTNNITDKIIDVQEDLTINTDDYFEYYLQGSTPNYSLSNNNITYDVNDGLININSESELNENTTINAEHNNETATSNEFNIKINKVEEEEEKEEEEDTTSDSDTTSTSTPSFSSPAIKDENETDNETDNEEENETEINETTNETNKNQEKSNDIIIIKDKQKNITNNTQIKEITQNKINNTPIKEFNETIYKAYEINANTTNTTTIEFEIEKEWFTNKNILIYDIAMHRYTNTWEELDTQIVKMTNTSILYEAKTPGFSYFIIGKKLTIIPETQEPKEIQKEEQENKNTNTNPFYFAATILTTLIITTIIIKHRLHV